MQLLPPSDVGRLHNLRFLCMGIPLAVLQDRSDPNFFCLVFLWGGGRCDVVLSHLKNVHSYGPKASQLPVKDYFRLNLGSHDNVTVKSH